MDQLKDIRDRVRTLGDPGRTGDATPGAPALVRPGARRAWRRRALAASLLLMSLASLLFGVTYWRASAIDARDRAAARTLILDAPPPALLEQRLATRYLTACVSAMTHWTFAIEPAADRARLTGECLAIVDAQERLDAAGSEAALVRAAAARLAGDADATMAQVLASQARAPRDLWSAIRRVELTLAATPTERLGDLGEYFAAEFSLLTGSNAGLETAVALYARHPILRPALLSIAEDMRPRDRLRFLNRIKRVARG